MLSTEYSSGSPWVDSLRDSDKQQNSCLGSTAAALRGFKWVCPTQDHLMKQQMKDEQSWPGPVATNAA